MAITVIKPEDMGYNFGGELGQSTGRGLKKIVDSLIQKKQQEHESEQQRSTLLNAGYSPEDAAAIQSGFSPEQVKLMQILSAGRTPPAPQGSGNPLESMGQPQGGEQPNEMASLFGEGQQPQIQQSQQPLTTAQKIGQYENPQIKFQREQAEKKEAATAGRHAEKLHFKEFNDINRRTRSADEKIKNIQLLRTLNDTGKLFQGVPRAILEKYNAEDLLTNHETQIASKLIERIGVQAMQDIPAGGRATDSWRKSVQKSFGRLLDSQEGLTELLNIAEDAEDQVKARGKAAKEIYKEYLKSGKPIPFDIDSDIDTKAQPAIDAISEKGTQRLNNILIKEDNIPATNYEKGKNYYNSDTGKIEKYIGPNKWEEVRKATSKDLEKVRDAKI